MSDEDVAEVVHATGNKYEATEFASREFSFASRTGGVIQSRKQCCKSRQSARCCAEEAICANEELDHSSAAFVRIPLSNEVAAGVTELLTISPSNAAAVRQAIFRSSVGG
jgi:hypothetical protein